MKKIIPIIITLIIILGISSILLIKKTIDYTSLNSSSLFMKSYNDYYKDQKKYSLPFITSSIDNYCLFKVVDNNDKPIRDYEITFFNTFNEKAILKTNKEGYAGISNLELVTYYFKTEDVINMQEINLEKDVCNFTLKGDNLIPNKRDRITLESEEKKALKDSISFNLDEYIFLKDEFKGEKLSITTSNDIKENKSIKREYYFNITNSYIKKIEIDTNTLNNNQEVLNLKNKKQNTFFNEEGFIIKENNTTSFTNTNIDLIITFEHNKKIYKIKNNITLKNDFRGSNLYINNNSSNDLKIEINHLDLKTSDETNIYTRILKSKECFVSYNIDPGNYVIKSYLNDKIYSTKYVEVKKGKLTYLELNEDNHEENII